MAGRRGADALIFGFIGMAVLLIAAKFAAGRITGPTALEQCLTGGGTWDAPAQACSPPRETP